MDTTARAQDSSPPSISTIGEDLTITGNVTSKGELHLHGQVQGDIRCVSLVLGEKAQLEGNVVAQGPREMSSPRRPIIAQTARRKAVRDGLMSGQ